MIKKQKIITSLIQIYSLVVKDLKLKTKYKSQFIVEFLTPLLSLFFPFIIFNTLFDLESNAFGGYYTKSNYVLFLLLAYCVECLIFLLWDYKDIFYNEKIWKTLKAVTLSPISNIKLLIGFFISGLLSKIIPIIIILIIALFLFPVNFEFFVLTLIVLLCIGLTFASMGFIIGIFEIVNENISAALMAGISFIALVSCLFYPIDIFPSYLQFFVKLNPLYYYFDLMRLTWWAGINNGDALRYITIYHLIIVIFFTIGAPIFSSYFFLKIYNKYGIAGY